MARHERFLPVAAKVFFILAWIVGIGLGIIVPIAIVFAGAAAQPPVPPLAGLLWCAFGLFQAFWFLTISCIISLLLDLKKTCPTAV